MALVHTGLAVRPPAPPGIPTEHLDLDLTMCLALCNLQFGLRKILSALRHTGGGEVSFVPTSDLSTTSNRTRWRSGFAYGGWLAWSSERGSIQFPELRPNACGVLLGSQVEPFDLRRLGLRIAAAKRRFAEDWDYDRGNHFLGLYRGRDAWYFLLHGGTLSIRRRLGLFEGEHTESPSPVFKACQRVATADGPCYVLCGDAADEYYALFKAAEDGIKEQRRRLARFLFPHATIRFHETHQGLLSPHSMVLGNYAVTEASSPIPFMVAHGEPLLLLGGGLAAQPLPGQGTVGSPRLSPHGSGDYLPELRGFRCIAGRGKRLYEFDLHDGGRVVADSPCGLREGHRPRERALLALRKLRIEILAELAHIATIKA